VIFYGFGILQANAQNENNGTIIGIVSFENITVENAQVTLYRLGLDENIVLDETITDSKGHYMFANLSKTTEYMIQVSLEGMRHSKYLLLNNSSEVNFDFSGRLTVQVSSVDDLDLEGLEVNLYNIFGVIESNTTLDYNGFSIFEPLDIQDTYYISLEHQRIPYTVIAEFGNKTLTEIQIEILESTKSDEDFQVAFQHIIVSEEGSDLRLRETVTVQNMGGKVFNTSWLMGWIPEGAFEVTHNTMDCCIQFFQSGDYTFDPMEPMFPSDTYSLSLSYKLKANIPNQIIEKNLIYDTERMFFLIEKTDKLTAESVNGVDLVSIEPYGESEYYFFEGTNLIAGELVQIMLKTQVSIFEQISKTIQVLDGYQLAIPIILVALFFVYQNRKNELEKLEGKESDLIEALVDAEIEYLEDEITFEELQIIREEAREASSEILEKLQELNPEEYSEVGLHSFEITSECRVVERVIDFITVDYEEEYISRDLFQKIYTKYDEKRKYLCTNTDNK
jgi:hypothetical protein